MGSSEAAANPACVRPFSAFALGFFGAIAAWAWVLLWPGPRAGLFRLSRRAIAVALALGAGCSDDEPDTVDPGSANPDSALSLEEACERIERDAGRQFDPLVAGALIDLLCR